MGSVVSFTNSTCLQSETTNLTECNFYNDYLICVQSINQIEKIIGKFIDGNFQALIPQDKRISWYQVIGQAVKHLASQLDMTDPIKNHLILIGRIQKLFGQMENEFACVCYSLLWSEIHKIRNYENQVIIPVIQRFETATDDYDEIHSEIHKSLTEFNSMLLGIRDKISAILEHQMYYSQYTTTYLEYVLRELKGNSKYYHPLKQYIKNIQCPPKTPLDTGFESNRTLTGNSVDQDENIKSDLKTNQEDNMSPERSINKVSNSESKKVKIDENIDSSLVKEKESVKVQDYSKYGY